MVKQDLVFFSRIAFLPALKQPGILLTILSEIINFAKTLGVSDIRIIPSAQHNKLGMIDKKTDLPILKYRLDNLKNNIPLI